MPQFRFTGASNETPIIKDSAVSKLDIQPSVGPEDCESATEGESEVDEDRLRKRTKLSEDSPTARVESMSSLTQQSIPETPSLHAKTSSIHIWNLFRPLVVRDLAVHISECAQVEATVVWFDRVRSHCFASFPSAEAAQRAREALNNQIFPPDDHSRKPMKADYIPTGLVDEWISLEERDGPRAYTRWQVVYTGGDGQATAQLKPCNSSSIPSSTKKESIPTGPAASQVVQSPTRKLSEAEALLRESTLRLRLQSSMLKNKASKIASPNILKRTKTKPQIFYSEAPSHVIEERLKRK